MAPRLINITLGTAGHIDHGKTALVKNLTGCDTDYLKEEKERGMSIELGFAPCTVADMEVGIVDVPGHENFVRTMVAGAVGMDGVVFVVAADDGVMPQTREHLDILTLLGVRHGIIALTKSDRVPPDQLEFACQQVRELLAGTFLADAPIVPVSNTTGAGFDALLGELRKLVDSIEPKRTDGLFRLPVEKTFSVKGYGTVITGIPVSGSARIGDELILMPQNQKGRIKTIQVYKHSSDTVLAGQCAALNIPQLDYGVITRGDVIVADACLTPQTWLLCRLKLLAGQRPPLRNGQKVKFHTGTSEVVASVYPMQEGDMPAGSEALAQIRLAAPVVTAPGDRFIVRSLSPVQTIGGGMVVDCLAARLKRSAVHDDLGQLAEAVLEDRSHVEWRLRHAQGYAASAMDIAGWARMPVAAVERILGELVKEQKAVKIGDGYMHAETIPAIEERLVVLVAEYHKTAPQSPGMEIDLLCSSSGADKPVVEFTVERLKKDGRLVERAHRMALPEHKGAMPDGQRDILEKTEAMFKAQLFAPPSEDEVAQALGLRADRVSQLVRLLIEHERLVVVEKGLYFHAEAVAEARRRLEEFIRKEGVLESVKFKYLLDTSRKFAIPLLDYFDRVGVTRRAGHSRYLQKP